MKKDDKLYGLKDAEYLEYSAEDIIERVIDNAVEKVGEPFKETASRIDWPIHVYVHRRRDIGGEACAKDIADRAVIDALERLDEEYMDPEGDPTESTDAITEAALAFGRAVVADYVPWSCEATGEVIEYTRKQVEKETGNG